MHKIICEMYGENVIAIKTCANWFKKFKNNDFDINDKNASQLWKKTERWEEVVEND